MAGKKSKESYIRNQQKKQKEEYERNGAVSRRSDIAGYSAQTLARYGIDSRKVLGNTGNAGSTAAGSGSGKVKSSKEDFISAYRERTAGGTSAGAAAGGMASDNWKRGILTQEQAAQRTEAEASGRSGLVLGKSSKRDIVADARMLRFQGYPIIPAWWKQGEAKRMRYQQTRTPIIFWIICPSGMRISGQWPGRCRIMWHI